MLPKTWSNLTAEMTIDPRLDRIVAAQPYPLLFATISGAHVLPLDAVVGLEVT